MNRKLKKAQVFKLPRKVLVISNRRNTGPFLVMSLQQLQQVDIILEPEPENAMHRWLAEMSDLIVVDVNLPGANLLELIRTMRFETIVPILLLTSNWSDTHLTRAYEAGVDECILKPISPSLLIAKVRVWLRRSGNVPAGTLIPLRAGNIQIIPSERIILLEDGNQLRITNLELRVLYCLMTQPGQSVPVEGLIQRVWGGYGIGEGAALKNIIYRLRQKIEHDPTNPKIIQTVTGVGYKFVALR